MLVELSKTLAGRCTEIEATSMPDLVMTIEVTKLTSVGTVLLETSRLPITADEAESLRLHLSLSSSVISSLMVGGELVNKMSEPVVYEARHRVTHKGRTERDMAVEMINVSLL